VKPRPVTRISFCFFLFRKETETMHSGILDCFCSKCGTLFDGATTNTVRMVRMRPERRRRRRRHRQKDQEASAPPLANTVPNHATAHHMAGAAAAKGSHALRQVVCRGCNTRHQHHIPRPPSARARKAQARQPVAPAAAQPAARTKGCPPAASTAGDPSSSTVPRKRKTVSTLSRLTQNRRQREQEQPRLSLAHFLSAI
jgi:hypothetical protein